MKTSLLMIVGICRIVSLQGRLTVKYSTPPAKLTESKPPIRLVREVFDDDSLTGFSREEDGQSDEFVQSYNRRARYFYKYKEQSSLPGRSMARLPRGSNGNASANNTERHVASADSQTVLIKKPIPKYNEGDYDEDFQARINKAAKTVADSGEHEDEDFNVDDYDFDVNHDEFAGRGKPLEPRIKLKETNEPIQPIVEQHLPNLEVETPKPKPEIKMQSKVNIPPGRTLLLNKKERAVPTKSSKISEKTKDDDYYEDVNIKDAAKEKIRSVDDDFGDDNEESKELDQKRSYIRNARSPWRLHSYAHKLGEKSPAIMSKALSILPMFPQVPKAEQPIEEETDSDSEIYTTI
ncbi:uncharacterized protein LOC115440517 [Manduca sexta]|uniref:Uncharacterized protein n=1 Tax=Manduca sexta TaxID=7130 RepID=A0A921YVH3_MANSE|nr:uncharacterized protein LOC115440517 [Manduca sexta]KAG6445524.1 hypothetical protein O3G_MSEX003966 [Manduca sexta]